MEDGPIRLDVLGWRHGHERVWRGVNNERGVRTKLCRVWQSLHSHLMDSRTSTLVCPPYPELPLGLVMTWDCGWT
jgi:hypothetical protein